MGKSLLNFLKDRQKFSPKKNRQPIHEYDGKMKRCPLHDDNAHRPCIGPGCSKFEQKHGNEGGACQPRAHARARVKPPQPHTHT